MRENLICSVQFLLKKLGLFYCNCLPEWNKKALTGSKGPFDSWTSTAYLKKYPNWTKEGMVASMNKGPYSWKWLNSPFFIQSGPGFELVHILDGMRQGFTHLPWPYLFLLLHPFNYSVPLSGFRYCLNHNYDNIIFS